MQSAWFIQMKEETDELRFCKIGQKYVKVDYI